MKLSSWGKGRRRFVLAFLLTILVVQFFPLISYAQTSEHSRRRDRQCKGKRRPSPKEQFLTW